MYWVHKNTPLANDSRKTRGSTKTGHRFESKTTNRLDLPTYFAKLRNPIRIEVQTAHTVQVLGAGVTLMRGP